MTKEQIVATLKREMQLYGTLITVYNVIKEEDLGGQFTVTSIRTYLTEEEAKRNLKEGERLIKTELEDYR